MSKTTFLLRITALPCALGEENEEVGGRDRCRTLSASPVGVAQKRWSANMHSCLPSHINAFSAGRFV